MPEYIERKLLLKELRKEHRECEKNWEKMGGESILLAEGVESAIDIVKGFPAADVAPVVHGRWTNKEYGFAKCSLCGDSLEVDFTSSNYCPHCGAKMDLEP